MNDMRFIIGIRNNKIILSFDDFETTATPEEAKQLIEKIPECFPNDKEMSDIIIEGLSSAIKIVESGTFSNLKKGIA